MTAFNDNLDAIWGRFFERRTRQLWDRYPGLYRAVVVETNDPLNMYRVRFKCPELHDHDLKPDHCPWAVSMHDLGGRRTGRWSHPIIDDWIWINFEKGHPYGPVWTGFSDPTRRKLYTYPSIYQPSPLSVNEKGEPADTPSDFDEEYLPKDGRPMSHGWGDRYGSVDIHRSYGFFPEEHAQAPPDPDFDALSKSKFQQKQAAPETNNPDAKYMVRISKYGHIFLQADQGYAWNNEFKGSFTEDESFEIDRWKYLQKLVNEDEATDTDQRRMLAWTRYGHLWEMRDVGWNMTREGEYGPSVDVGEKNDIDFRWIKWRSKGGHILQAYDKGFDPVEDLRVKKKLIDEVADKSEKEGEWWGTKDARWWRMATRHGYKIVIDDRGAHSKESGKRCLPRGNGILIKGRRPASSQGHQLAEMEPGVDGVQVGGDLSGSGGGNGENGNGDMTNSGNIPGQPYQAGFWWEFNENEGSNWSSWGSPLGQVMFINDKIQYVMLCSRLDKYARPFMGLEENEFVRESPTVSTRSAEKTTYHLKLDLDNEYLRLKTRAANGDKPFVPPSDGCHMPSPRTINKSGLEKGDENQGLECHDGEKGDGPWVEVVDAAGRAIWFSTKFKMSVFHNNMGASLSFSEEDGTAILQNNMGGSFQIRCSGDLNIVSEGNINLLAAKNINMQAGAVIVPAVPPDPDALPPLPIVPQICAQAGGTSLVVNPQLVGTSGPIHATVGNMRFPGVEPGGGAGSPSPQLCTIILPEPVEHEKVSPEDRAKHYNDDFDNKVEVENIEHPESYMDSCVDDGRGGGEEEE